MESFDWPWSRPKAAVTCDSFQKKKWFSNVSFHWESLRSRKTLSDVMCDVVRLAAVSVSPLSSVCVRERVYWKHFFLFLAEIWHHRGSATGKMRMRSGKSAKLPFWRHLRNAPRAGLLNDARQLFKCLSTILRTNRRQKPISRWLINFASSVSSAVAAKASEINLSEFLPTKTLRASHTCGQFQPLGER